MLNKFYSIERNHSVLKSLIEDSKVKTRGVINFEKHRKILDRNSLIFNRTSELKNFYRKSFDLNTYYYSNVILFRA